MSNLYKNIKINIHPITNKRNYINIVYPEIQKSSEDMYIITSFEDRLDLLAYQYYGDPNLWWVISQANPDKVRRDSFFIKLGEQIRIPNPNDIERFNIDFDEINRAR
jgi:hypothetical protein|tara:strand:+ start:6855 stop:7175 length:321 start_codon:yes stop_codon:yes gene_type:complete